MGDLAHIGDALRLIRERARLSQEQLGAQCGLGAAQISRYERGFHSPRIDSVDALLSALGLTLHDLAYALDVVTGKIQERREDGLRATLPESSSAVYRALADTLERLERLEVEVERERRAKQTTTTSGS